MMNALKMQVQKSEISFLFTIFRSFVFMTKFLQLQAGNLFILTPCNLIFHGIKCIMYIYM